MCFSIISTPLCFSVGARLFWEHDRLRDVKRSMGIVAGAWFRTDFLDSVFSGFEHMATEILE